MRIRRLLVVGLAFGLIASACGSDDDPNAAKEGPTITVGSANFPESILLGEIYAQGLAAKGFKTDTKPNIGARELYFPALEKGEIDFFPEYVGSLLSYKTKQKVTASPDTDKAVEQLDDNLGDKVVHFAASAAADQDGIVVNKETADKYNLSKVSDLKEHGPMLILVGPPECETRQACLKGLNDVYGVTFKEFKKLAPNGPQTVEVLKANEGQVANLFTTNPAIAINNFVLLDDDKGIVGAENVLPVATAEIADAYGDDLAEAVDAISAKLTTAGLTDLNKLHEVDKGDPEDIAKDWLESNGLI